MRKVRAKRPYQKKPKRIGRGVGSGHGKTSTKGHKGQRARSGFHQRPTFEGGQTPIHQKFPKRGFNQPNHKSYAILNLDQLDRLKVSEISPDWLIQNKVLKSLGDGLKVLGRGKLSAKMTVQAHRFSGSAKTAIEKAGGKAILIEHK
ncbi:MAG: 50S ribosomal protein L15 [Candidatus Omnitrophica bacterium]|nr:50S ribosomal protein L15 [Candidatus Omnitrophota bacterium]